MKIVAHNGATIWGGAERATTQLLAELAARGHEVLLLCNSPLVMEMAQRAGVPSEQLVIGGDLVIHHAFRLKRRLAELKPDVFIVGTFKKLFFAALGAKMAGVSQTVARVGLESDTPRKWKYRYALRRWTSGVVANSTTIADAFSIDGFDRTKVKVIHNGVKQLERTRDPISARIQLGLPPGAFVIGTVARLAIQKRIDRLVEAVSLLPENVHCIVAGDGTRRGNIEALIADKKLSQRFQLLGHRDDVADVLSALDGYVVSSDTEGLSNSMLEAMSMGIPIVSTAVSGAADALASSDASPAGFIVDHDPRSIAGAVQRLMNDQDLRQKMGFAAARTAADEFSMKKMIDSWELFLSRA